MYELNKILSFGRQKLQEKHQLVLATIVRTEGSTYRKAGTQMIVADDLSYEGAISGGCVENEVVRQATTVFSGAPNFTFEYDGRYKLGCNGKIYLLLELIDAKKLDELSAHFDRYDQMREPFYLGIASLDDHDYSYFRFGDNILWNGESEKQVSPQTHEIQIHPQHQAIVIGSEYDAILLSKFSSLAGLKTHLIGKDIIGTDHDFQIMNIEPEELKDHVTVDANTAIVVMTHSFSRDLHFLKEVMKFKPGYLGILGPQDRKDRIMNDLMEMEGFDLLEMAEDIYAPIGLDIGATLPEEISVAILSEIISVFRNGKSLHLKDRLGSIHIEKN